MVSKGQAGNNLIRDPAFDDMITSLHATVKQPRGVFREIRKVVAIARRFNDEVVRPQHQDIDLKCQSDPEFIPHEWLQEANRWGFFTLWLPKMFGGKGYCFASLAYFVEEVASVCLGMGNLIGVHYLGLSTLMATWQTPMISRICRDVVQGEKNDAACTISFAMTEPNSGTDTAETDLLDRADVSCHMKKVQDGYEVSGTKIFISNGAVSTWHMVVAFADLENPSDNGVIFAVKTGTKGFSCRKKEHKMGQLACPVSELVFDKCFIPDDQVCMDAEHMQTLKRNNRETYQQILDFVVSTTRTAVCAFGAGAARGSFEAALDFASRTEVNGRLLSNHEWVQCKLAEMHKNVATARLIYSEANYANGLYGFFAPLQAKPVYYLLKMLPAGLLAALAAPFLKTGLATRIFRMTQLDAHSEEHMNRVGAWSSLAKFAGTDAAMENCRIALEIMGQAGLRHSGKVEKFLRDAKLLQIYEGTNQLNRMIHFRCLAKTRSLNTSVFDE